MFRKKTKGRSMLQDDASSEMLVYEDKDYADTDDDAEPLRSDYEEEEDDDDDSEERSVEDDDDDDDDDDDASEDSDDSTRRKPETDNSNRNNRSNGGESRFKKPNLEFTPEELPLIGYTVASLVFFLSAITRRHKVPKGLSNSVSSSGTAAAASSNSVADLYNNILGNIYDDASAFDDDSIVDDALSDGMLKDYMGSVFEACEASYNDICGNNNFFFDSMGGYGSMLPTGHFAYALCLGIFGAFFGVGVLAWMRHNASKAAKRPVTMDDSGDPLETFSEDEEDKTRSEVLLEKYRWLVNSVLLLWAFLGWAFFTFGGNDVFAYTGNGFFALWAMMLFAVWNFGITAENLVEQSEKADFCIYALIVTSIITVIELTTGLGGWRYQGNKGISGYALAVSVTSILFGLVTAGFSFLAARGRSEELDLKIRFWAVVVILVLSILAAFLTTFIGPFLTTGNGYFAAWGSVVCSGLAYSRLKNEMQQLDA